jgi:eukaryotic-like serine/threonine-protein kinase
MTQADQGGHRLTDEGLTVRLTRNELSVLSDLLDVGLELREPERTAWLEDLSEPFAGAKVVLRKMLAHDSRGAANEFLNSLPKFATNQPWPMEAEFAAAPCADSMIGAYVLIEEIGRGGMSTVWLGRRTDELTERLVALKLPDLHLRDARFAERFAHERDILAKLTHPHIAHLYDAGISLQGQPYLVMEFVEGEGLMEYCAQHRLDVAQRLGLFLQILDAVDHAHALGVIHRDIKPSNILVRGGGHVVLLDFGIAKLLVEGQAAASELTQRGGAVFTLHYASPEQLKGDTLTPQTDVYSLGVVLYELLCGRRPHESDTVEHESRRALEEAILSVDPDPPSNVVKRNSDGPDGGLSPEKLRRVLRGDLDTIVIKALRKSPAERYASCGLFAEDLRRHLRGDAVSARPNSGWYRLRRLARRHQSALLGAGAVGMTVAAVVAMVTGPFGQHAGPQAALGAIGRAIAVLPFDNMSGDASNDYFAQGIQDEVLTRLANISGLKVMSRRAAAAFGSHPERLKGLRQALSVGSVLEGSVQKQDDRVLVNVQLIETAGNTHLWAESFDRPAKDIFGVERDIAEAVAEHLQAKLLPLERASVEAVDTPNVDAHTADLWGRFYMAKRDDKSLQKAVEYFNEAVRLDPNYAMAYSDLSTALFYLANSLDESDSSPVKDQARVAAQRALALAPNLADAHVALGWVLLYLDWDLSGAERELALAVRLAPNSSRAKNGLATMYAVFGELDRAVALMNEARTLDPLSSIVATNLANYTLGQEKYEAAESWYRKALELDQNAPYCHGNLAIIALARGNLKEAEREANYEPDEESKDYALTMVRQNAADQTAADRALREFIHRHEKYSPYLIASLYAFRGDADNAFRWLDRAYRTRDVGTIDILQSPFFLRFRSDPRFRTFSETLGVARRMPLE